MTKGQGITAMTIDELFIRLYNVRIALATGQITRQEARLELLMIARDLSEIA